MRTKKDETRQVTEPGSKEWIPLPSFHGLEAVGPQPHDPILPSLRASSPFQIISGPSHFSLHISALPKAKVHYPALRESGSYESAGGWLMLKSKSNKFTCLPMFSMNLRNYFCIFDVAVCLLSVFFFPQISHV